MAPTIHNSTRPGAAVGAAAPGLSLTYSEDARMLTLADHEATIERGLKTFVEVGNALAAIRDGKLYKADHATFEDYCKVRWGWTDRYARMLMQSTDAVHRIAETGTVVPATERQARPLTKLPPEEQADAWEEVVAESEATGEKITAKKVEAVVAKRRGGEARTAKAFERSLRLDPHDIPQCYSRLRAAFGSAFCQALGQLIAEDFS